jgi:hypothetical protein
MGFKQLFWGFLFMFDFRINKFDILPDFIGYILFIMGLSKLLDLNENFNKAKKFAIPLIALSLPGIYEIKIENFSSTEIWVIVLFYILSTVTIVLDLCMVYFICKGIKSLALAKGKTMLYNKADVRWKLYLTVAVITSLMLILIGLPQFIVILIIPLFVFSLIVLILMMLLMNESEESLG